VSRSLVVPSTTSHWTIGPLLTARVIVPGLPAAHVVEACPNNEKPAATTATQTNSTRRFIENSLRQVLKKTPEGLPVPATSHDRQLMPKRTAPSLIRHDGAARSRSTSVNATIGPRFGVAVPVDNAVAACEPWAVLCGINLRERVRHGVAQVTRRGTPKCSQVRNARDSDRPKTTEPASRPNTGANVTVA